MEFSYVEHSGWPPLSWVAQVRKATSGIEVHHGPRVETGDDWFGEIVWDGDFQAADFDKTDIVAGSGARLRDGAVDFVSPGSTVDRLALLDKPDEFVISNSLALLLSYASLSLEPSYGDYAKDMETISRGFKKALRRLRTKGGGDVELIYYENYRWDGQQGERIDKPFPRRDFSSYERYRDFMQTCLRLMSENLHDKGRRHPFRLLTTISSGYDSPTVAALALDCNVSKALTFGQSKDGRDDSGAAIAQRLGLDVVTVESDAWMNGPPIEAAFYASCGFMGENVYQGYEEHLSGAVVLTGYHGDAVWGLNDVFVGEDFKRYGSSGLGLTEYRLMAGFVNCPVAYFGARQIGDIHELSRLPDMADWSLSGTDYNRPFCRRLVEEAGVPREWFGMEKKAVGMRSYRFYLSPPSFSSYKRFLREHQKDWWRDARVPPVRSQVFDRLIDQPRRGLYNLGVAAVNVKRRGTTKTGDQGPPDGASAKREPGGPSTVQKVKKFLARPRNLQRFVIPWALEECKRRYLL